MCIQLSVQSRAFLQRAGMRLTYPDVAHSPCSQGDAKNGCRSVQVRCVRCVSARAPSGYPALPLCALLSAALWAGHHPLVQGGNAASQGPCMMHVVGLNLTHCLEPCSCGEHGPFMRQRYWVVRTAALCVFSLAFLALDFVGKCAKWPSVTEDKKSSQHATHGNHELVIFVHALRGPRPFLAGRRERTTRMECCR